jgi:hypothetical protein
MMKNLFLPLAFIVIVCSCNNYYKAMIVTNLSKVASIEGLKLKNKYFILRAGTQAFSVTNISFTDDQKTMHCNLGKLSNEHTLYVSQGIQNKMKYGKENAKQDETFVLDEVHLYITAVRL